MSTIIFLFDYTQRLDLTKVRKVRWPLRILDCLETFELYWAILIDPVGWNKGAVHKFQMLKNTVIFMNINR